LKRLKHAVQEAVPIESQSLKEDFHVLESLPIVGGQVKVRGWRSDCRSGNRSRNRSEVRGQIVEVETEAGTGQRLEVRL
jgi:hypothetical protein